MTSRGKVPDAWDDDDWDAKADDVRSHVSVLERKEIDNVQQPLAPAPVPASSTEPEKLSKRERRAKQLELNKKLWDEALVHVLYSFADSD